MKEVILTIAEMNVQLRKILKPQQESGPGRCSGILLIKDGGFLSVT